MLARSQAGASSAGTRTPAPGEITVSTRSGNTATPDDTWSPWSKTYSNPSGEQIVSPNARYLQWRAVLSANGSQLPVLTSVTTAYLPRNLRPEVTSITVHPAGTVFQRPFSTGELEIAGFEDNTSDGRGQNPAQSASSIQTGSTPALGRRIYQKGLQTFVWKADDDNDDKLQYDVMYRREGETSWKTLHRASDRSHLRLGHDVGARRHVLHQGGRRRMRRRIRPAPR